MRFWSAVLVGCLVLAGCSNGKTVQFISPDGKQTLTITVEVASDEASRERGLMDREHLENDAGMLFTFDAPHALAFWMKNTLIPLDVLFFDADGQFVSSDTMVPCRADPCVVYRSTGPAMYAVEVNAGFVQRNSIGGRWKIVMEK